MRCRECGLELDERDQLQNGAYQCPECGTIHHTASSSKASPSPWRRKRGSALTIDESPLKRRLWVLPLWSWIVIALVAVTAIVLVLTLTLRSPAPDDIDMPPVQDIPLSEDQTGSNADGAPITDAENALLGDLEGQTGVEVKRTNTAINDFLVSFEWSMNYLNYKSPLTLISEETGLDGSLVRSYSYEDWLNLNMTLDPDTLIIRSIVATANGDEASAAAPDAADGAEADATEAEPTARAESEAETRMLAGFVCTMYSVDTSLSASGTRTELKTMLADSTRTLTGTGFTASLSYSEFSGYTLEINGTV